MLVVEHRHVLVGDDLHAAGVHVAQKRLELVDVQVVAGNDSGESLRKNPVRGQFIGGVE